VTTQFGGALGRPAQPTGDGGASIGGGWGNWVDLGGWGLVQLVLLGGQNVPSAGFFTPTCLASAAGHFHFPTSEANAGVVAEHRP
jgi:hypothetical protein